MTHATDNAYAAHTDHSEAPQSGAASRRKPYRAPSLEVFGSVRGLTEGSAGSSGDGLPGTMRMNS